MPILPPTVTPPYDTVESALQIARTRLNDAIQSIGGEILTDTAPFTQTVVKAAWRRLQQYLANLGYTTQTNEVVLVGLPPVTQTTTDPATQVWLNWSQYFDGANYYAPPQTPVLPQDLIAPLRVQERWSGQNAVFNQMINQLDGLPRRNKTQWNGIWEWRNNCLRMPGSQMTMDLLIRYLCYLPDFVDQGDVPWYQQPIPIMYCLNALADYICYEMAKPRGDLNADDFKRSAEAEANLIFNRDVQAKQRTNVRRRPYGRTGRNYGGWYW